MTEAQKQIIQKLDQILAATGGGGGGAAWGAITGALGDQTDLSTALGLKQTAAQVQTIADAKVESEAYGPDWNGDTTHAPAKNDVYDKIEAVVASIPAAHSGGVIGTAGFAPATLPTLVYNTGVIASVAASATGLYDVIFTVPQPDANYSAIPTAGKAGGGTLVQVESVSKSVSNFQIRTMKVSDGSDQDADFVEVIVTRLSQ